MHTEAVEVFEYEKNNDGYWDGAKLHQQVVNKALPIAEALYLVTHYYSFLIMQPVIQSMQKMHYKSRT